MAFGRRLVVVSGGPVTEGENTYTAALLGKIPILIGKAQRRTMPMACTCYGGYVLELLSLAGWRREPK
jgi:hypothetical protein